MAIDMILPNHTNHFIQLARRFRGFLPVVVDVETGGFNAAKDALLEVAAVFLKMDDYGKLQVDQTVSCHVLPFEGANMDPSSLEVTKIDPYHPFRFAVEEAKALETIFQAIRDVLKQAQAERAILIGHNANFDLSFLQAACKRCKILNNPFHSFSVLDTATLSALAFGETILARAMKAAKISFDKNQAHSAIYDAEKTAELFCWIVNRWGEKVRA